MKNTNTMAAKYPLEMSSPLVARTQSRSAERQRAQGPKDRARETMTAPQHRWQFHAREGLTDNYASYQAVGARMDEATDKDHQRSVRRGFIAIPLHRITQMPPCEWDK